MMPNRTSNPLAHLRPWRYGPLLLLVLLLASACERDLPGLDTSTALYPIEPGRFRTYRVDSIGFELASGLPDTVINGEAFDLVRSRYYRREWTKGEEEDQEGRIISRLEIWRADINGAFLADSAYSYQELWTQYKDLSFAERTEGNITYRVLRFPADEGRSWNGNALNSQGEQLYRYERLDSTLSIGSYRFDSAAVVIQRQDFSQLQDAYIYEVYAPGIGKVKRSVRFIQTDLITNDVTGEVTPRLNTSSVLYEEVLVDHNYDR